MTAKSESSLRLTRNNMAILLTRAGTNETMASPCSRTTVRTRCKITPRRLVRIGTLRNSSDSGVPNITKINTGATLSLVRSCRGVSCVCRRLSRLRVGPNIHRGLHHSGRGTCLSLSLNAVEAGTPISAGTTSCIPTRGDTSTTELFTGCRLFDLVSGFRLGVGSTRTPRPRGMGEDVVGGRTSCSDLRFNNGTCFCYTISRGRVASVCFTGNSRVATIRSFSRKCTRFVGSFFRDSIRGCSCGAGCLRHLTTSLNATYGGIHKSLVLSTCLLHPSSGGCRVSRLYTRCNISIPRCGGRLNSTSRGIMGTTILTSLFTGASRGLRRTGRGRLLRGVRLPLTHILNGVRVTNFRISGRNVRDFSSGLFTEVGRLASRVCRTTKRRFGVGSPGRLNIILFRRLRVPYGGGAGDNCSAGTRVLRRLTPRCPVIGLVLRCEDLSGLGSACYSNLLGIVTTSKEVRASFGRIRAHANEVSSLRPGLRGVPVEARLNGRVHHFFITKRNGALVSTSCDRVRLHILTTLTGSGGVVTTFGGNRSVRHAATTRIFGLPTRVMAPLLHSHTGTIGFNVICNVNTFDLTGSVNISIGRTGSCVGNCLGRFSNITRCVGGVITSTGRGNCTRALFGHHHCLPRLTSSGRVVHTFNREITVGVPVRNATTSVVGVTVVEISGHLRGRGVGSHLVLRIRSRLVIRTPLRRTSGTLRVIARRVRGTYGFDIGLLTSNGVNGA